MKSQADVLQEAVTMLETTLGMVDELVAEEPAKDIGRSFVYRHAVYVRDLAVDALTLGRAGRWASIYLLSRPAMESVFKMAAACKVKEFPAEKVVSEVETERKKLEKWRKSGVGGWGPILDEVVRQCDAFEQDLRARYGVTAKREWHIAEVAREGKLEADYVKHYFRGCKHVHGMLSGLVDREDGLYIPDAVYGLTSGLAMAVVLLEVYFRLPVDLVDDSVGIVRKAKEAFDGAMRAAGFPN
jgi:hypothetical protein